jgi:ParB family chromosome partitioning protein
MMADEQARSRLGRGLAALIGEGGDETATAERPRSQRRVPVAFLRPNPRNPRQRFGEEDLAELTESIREKGVVQPILVRPLGGRDSYEIIAGERRWRAAQTAGIHEVPVVVLDVGEREALEIAIVENVQRADLNPIEEALGYGRLIEEFRYTQADLAKVIGKSRSHIANTLRLVKLPDTVRVHVLSGALSAGHARALLAVADPETVATRILRDGLTVRDVEAIGQREARGEPARPVRLRPAADADSRALEKSLGDLLGLEVQHRARATGGELRLRYRTLDQLDDLLRRLKH